MRQFFAILKDSFREAVDGFVVYAMLGLGGVLVLIAASMSFTPVPPEQAFATITKGFVAIVPDQGRSRAIAVRNDVKYRAEDVRQEGDGYRLRLVAVGEPESADDNDRLKGDSFRAAVGIWAAATGKTIRIDPKAKKVDAKGNGRGIEVALGAPPSVQQQRAVTDDQMEAFVRSEFVSIAGMTTTVTRVKAGADEPTYAFDVQTGGGVSVQGWPHATKIFFGTVALDDETPLGVTLWLIEDIVINRFGGTFALLVGMIITAFFIPNMLRKGSVDLLISKPIGRAQLLAYKYVGGLTFMLLVTTFTVGGIWLVLAVRSGYWDPAFLTTIPLLTFTFAVFYAVSTLVATFTRSAIAAMLLSVGFAFFMFVFGAIKANYDEVRAAEPDKERPPAIGLVLDNAYAVLPRTRDLDQLIRRNIANGTLTPPMRRLLAQTDDPAPPAATFGVSLAHILWMLGVSCWWFSRRDY